MITINKLSNALGAAHYFSQADDYYREGGSAPAYFMGAGATRAGLAGDFGKGSEKAFLAALEGRVAGQQIGKAGSHTPGWDLTFSAPKSVSIAALTGDDRLVAGHDRAVRLALEHLEKHAFVTRQRDQSGHYAWRNVEGVIAAFRHTTSREKDLQLHTHAIVINGGFDRQSGQWRSLDSREIYAARAEATSIYMAELAAAVRETGRAVDWRITPDGYPTFELTEVPEALRRELSGRKAAIDAALAERGLTRETASQGARQAAALSTRQRKDAGADRAQLAAQWKETARAHGYDPDARPVGTVTPDQRRAAAADAVQRAVEHLAERDARFSRRDLEHEARIYGQGHAHLEDIRAAIAAAEQDGTLITRQSWGRVAGGQRGHREGFTTREGIQTERAMMATAAHLERGDGSKPVDSSAIDQAIDRREHETGLSMTDEQRDAVRGILASDSRLHVLAGHAGTAKTRSVLATVATEAQAHGYTVRAMAPTGSAAQTLGEALQGDHVTVAGALHGRADEGARHGRELWIVDEAGMVSARDMRDLLAQAETRGARVILSGDSRQIGSVGAGAAFGQLESSIVPEHRHTLTQIVRQRDAGLREAVHDAVSGRVRAALSKANTVELKTRAEQIEHAAERYCAHADAGRSTLIIALSRADRAEINARVHELRVGSGQVTDTRQVAILESRQWTNAQRSDAARYAPGDMIVWGAAHRGGGPDKGEQTPVIGVADSRITVAREDGSEWSFDPRRTTRYDVATRRELEIGASSQIVTRASLETRDGPKLPTGTRLQVESVTDDRIVAYTDRGDRVELDAQRVLALDHAYCMTADQAQGRTVDAAIGVMRSGQQNLADQSRLYVAISRARDQAEIVTDDRARLAEILERNDGSRQTAIEHALDPLPTPDDHQPPKDPERERPVDFDPPESSEHDRNDGPSWG